MNAAARRTAVGATWPGLRLCAAVMVVSGKASSIAAAARRAISCATSGLTLVDRLTGDQEVWPEEYFAAHEWGLALEMLADWPGQGGAA